MRRFHLTLIFGLTLTTTVGTSARGQRVQVDKGQAAAYPWSGSWWPHQQGGLVKPLQKYDSVSGTAAAAWEQANHVAAAAGPSAAWFGHCHAWSASSVQEGEPTSPRQFGSMIFKVGDQKGLLAACHAQDVANSYGQRFDVGGSAEAYSDLKPDELWRILQLYLQRQKLPLILDLEAGPQVWNYPVYQYEVDYQIGSGGVLAGTMTLLAADNNVVPDYIGTQYTVHRYTFQAQTRGGAIVAGSSAWTGRSLQDHPDFAWYPYVAVAENPSVSADQVGQIVGFQVGRPRNAPPDPHNPVPVGPTPPTPPTPDPSPLPPPPNPQPVDVVPLDELLDPYQIAALIANKKSDFVIDAMVDRGDGGIYGPGDPVKITLVSKEPGYLYLFDIDPAGKPTLVFPRLGEPNQLKADTVYRLPGEGIEPFLVAGEQGQHDLKAIVTDRPLKLTGFRQPAQSQQQQQKQQPTQMPIAPKPRGKAVEPEPIYLPPTTEGQVEKVILAGLRGKGTVSKPEVPIKVRFAQDASAYFVTKAGKR